MAVSNKTSSSKYSFLALGDSYTIGESLNIEHSWPFLLQYALSTTKYAIDTPKIIAKTGWTTEDLLRAIEREKSVETFDFVSLLIGVNNQYQGKSTVQFRSEFIALLRKAIDYANQVKKNVFVLSIPDWSVTPFAQGKDKMYITNEIDLFNVIAKEETLKSGIQFIDITGISRQSLNEQNYIAADGLHFSKLMHQLWVNKIISNKFKTQH